MIERIIFGVILGVIGESFDHSGHSYQKMLIILIGSMFVIDSATFGLTYGLMALSEITVGFLGSGYLRTLRLTRGWLC